MKQVQLIAHVFKPIMRMKEYQKHSHTYVIELNLDAIESITPKTIKLYKWDKSTKTKQRLWGLLPDKKINYQEIVEDGVFEGFRVRTFSGEVYILDQHPNPIQTLLISDLDSDI